MFSFDIKKPADIKSALLSVEHKIINSGGKFSGGVESGEFANVKGDVVGRYSVEKNNIKIIIIKKPFIYPESAVEKRIREYFEQ